MGGNTKKRSSRKSGAGQAKAKPPAKKKVRPEPEPTAEESQVELRQQYDASQIADEEKQLDGATLAQIFLDQHAAQSAMQQRENPAIQWLELAWNDVQRSCVRFAEAPRNHPPNQWADVATDKIPRSLNVEIWPGDPNGTDVALDKIAEAIKTPLKDFTIEELIAVCNRISTYAESVSMKPASMLNLALTVFRAHPSVAAALLQNSIGTIRALNRLLERVYSTTDQVNKYLSNVRRPRHRNYEEFNIFMQRCIAAYVSVSWYVKLSEVVVGMVRALPLNIWGDTVPTLADALREQLERPDLQGIGKLCLEHEAQFSTLVETVWDASTRKHQLQHLGANPEATQPNEWDQDRDRRRGRRTDDHSRRESRQKLGKRPREERLKPPVEREVTTAQPTGKCYACGKPGHHAPKCTDATAKATYEKKRNAERSAAASAKGFKKPKPSGKNH